MMKIVSGIILFVVISFLGVHIYRLVGEQKILEKEVAETNAKLQALQNEEVLLNKDLEYFSDIHNLAKEFKSLFNYKKPDERLIIIIPKDIP